MKDFWKELPIWVKIIIIAVLAVLIFILTRNLIVYIKKVKAENILNNSIATGGTGAGAYSVNFGSVAQRIYACFYENDWFGWTEDEEGAIVALNDVPKPFIPQLKKAYFDLYNKDLNADFTKYLSTSNYSRVQNQFN